MNPLHRRKPTGHSVITSPKGIEPCAEHCNVVVAVLPKLLEGAQLLEALLEALNGVAKTGALQKLAHLLHYQLAYVILMFLRDVRL